MSLLLKALEKSEEARQDVTEGGAPSEKGSSSPSPSPEGQQPQQPASEGSSAPVAVAPAKEPAAAASGGFKLGGAGGGSKLSSALGAVQDEEKKKAVRVVSAYASADEDEDESEALTRQITKSRIRTVAMLVGVVVVAGVGYYVADQQGYLSDQDSQVASSSSDEKDVIASSNVVEDFSDASLALPLVDPEFDVQKDILQAVLSSDKSGSSSSGSNNEDLSERIASFTKQLLQESIEEARRRREEEDVAVEALGEFNERNLRDRPLSDQLVSLVSGEEAIPFVEPNEYMLSRLSELGKNPYKDDATEITQYIGPSRVAQTVSQENETKESNIQPRVAQAAPKAVIAKVENKLEELFNQGVADYERGDFDAAENTFRSLLVQDPNSSNAMLGLAKVYGSRGNVRLAINTLLRASELDPKSPLIIAELVALQADSAQTYLSEKKLLSLLGASNARAIDAQLQFLLGGIYAKQERWLEAKNSYFHAYGAVNDNPDYAYNLAVVYDFLNEPKNAIKMYRTAVDLASNKLSAFEPAIALARADELESL